VAAIKAELKRGFLNSLWRQCQVANGAGSGSGGPPAFGLIDFLNSFQDAGFSRVKSGRVLTVTTGAGHSATFAPWNVLRSFTEEEVFSLSQELLETYQAAILSLSLDTPPVTQPTDNQIFAAMMAADNLQTVTSLQHDYLTIRFPYLR